jgi:hypothetical protein
VVTLARLVALLSLIGLAAQAAAGAPVLVQAADALSQNHLREASAVAARLARSAPSSEPPARSLLRLVDALYQELQFDGAVTALQLADRCRPISKGDQAQLELRRGMLEMESFDEAGARRLFQAALDLDRSARLPDLAPPKTVHLLEELRGALPPLLPPPPPAPAPVALAMAKPVPPRAPAQGLRSWAWAPAAGGAAMGVAGGALYLLAKGNYDRLAARDPSLTTQDQVRATAATGRLQQTWSVVLLGAGAVALGSAAVLALSPNGVAVSGTFP